MVLLFELSNVSQHCLNGRCDLEHAVSIAFSAVSGTKIFHRIDLSSTEALEEACL